MSELVGRSLEPIRRVGYYGLLVDRLYRLRELLFNIFGLTPFSAATTFNIMALSITALSVIYFTVMLIVSVRVVWNSVIVLSLNSECPNA